MPMFFLFGKYSSHALKSASSARTRKAEHLIAKFRGRVKWMYALLGPYDLVLAVELPGVEEALKVSAGLSKLTGIGFTTCPAISVQEFDRIIQEV